MTSLRKKSFLAGERMSERRIHHKCLTINDNGFYIRVVV